MVENVKYAHDGQPIATNVLNGPSTALL